MAATRGDEIDLGFLRYCLREAGARAFAHRGERTAEVKADRTPVTELDRQVEALLIRRIEDRYPGHRILSEETGTHGGTEGFAWVIDPIDGTRAFASGLPIWGISIGILHNGRPYAGGLYLPVTGEMYWGTTAAAHYNDRQLEPIRSVDLDSPLAFLAVPSSFHLRMTITYPRVRSMGSTAAHLAYTVTGAAVGTITQTVGLWDLASMLPVMQAVGIEMRFLSGEPFVAEEWLDGRQITQPLIAAHPQVLDTLRDSVREI